MSKKTFHKLASVDNRNDNASATRFIDVHGEKLRYVVSWKCWLAWTGKKWCRESGDDRAMKQARSNAKNLWQAASSIFQENSISDDDKSAVLNFVKQSNDLRRIESMMKLARHDERISVQHSLLDSDPYLLNLLNGTFDLRSSTFRKHQQEDLLTQVANVRYDRDAKCPQWTETIELIFDGNAELIRYVQQLLGYSCSGLVGAEVLPICYGSGCNGKSTIWNTVAKILGDYSRSARQELLLPTKSQHPEIIAALHGKRFVTIAEPEAGRQLLESTAKMLSSIDRIECRGMNENSWSFEPTHKIWIPTNHKPIIKGTDQGIWRRIKLIPFAVDLRRVTSPKENFASWLFENEASGILNWLIAGFNDYQTNGLIEPTLVTVTTNEYRSDSDELGEFIREFCIQEPDAISTSNELFQRYEETVGNSKTALSKTTFGTEMSNRFQKEKPTSGTFRRKVIYHGIRLRTDSDENCKIPEENTSCHQLSPVNRLVSPASVYGDGAEQLVTTSAKTDSEVCKCGSEMVPAVEVNGYRNWDCPQCQMVKVQRLEVAQC